jgi:hypothetical protein
MDILNISNSDIDLFINSYNSNLLNGTCNNLKIQNYVMLLKTIKYYRESNIQIENQIFKQYNIDSDDIPKIYKLLNRLKNGKNLYHRELTTIQNNNLNNGNIYSRFNINEVYDETPKFELTSKLEHAQNEYQNKLNKMKQKKEMEKMKRCGRIWHSVENIPDPYYGNSNNVEQPALPSRNNNEIIINNFLNEKQYNNFGIDPFENNTALIQQKTNNYSNIYQNRFQQDVDICSGNTRTPSFQNAQPFENQFQYLNDNYNRVPDDRLFGISTRYENREYAFKR